MKELKYFLHTAFLLWLTPFVLRIVKPAWFVATESVRTGESYVSPDRSAEIDQLIINRDLQGTFRVILLNNLKVGLINITGSAMLGIPTAVSLFANGLNLAGYVHLALDRGITPGYLFGHLLAPHLIELLGIWLTAASGLFGASLCVRYLMRERLPGKRDYWVLGGSALVGMLIIIVAAWLEVFVTIKNYLH